MKYLKTSFLKKRSIFHLIRFNTFLSTLIAVFFLGSLWIFQDYRQFKRESANIRNANIATEESVLQSEASKALNLITEGQLQSNEELISSLRSQARIAYNLAKNIYNENSGITSDNEIKAKIVKAIRPITFNGTGYFYITDSSGFSIMHGRKLNSPEGKDISSLSDSKNTAYVKNYINTSRQKGEVLFEYFDSEVPNNFNETSRFISYAKYFSVFDWIIGAEDYYNYHNKDFEEDILRKLSQIRFGKEGFINVVDFEGNVLIQDGKRRNLNLWNFTDTKGVKVFQKKYEYATLEKGGFLSYFWKRTGKDYPETVYSYVLGDKNSEWIISANHYITDAEEKIEGKREQLKHRVNRQLYNTGIVIFVLIIIVLIISNVLSKRINRSFKQFYNFFAGAARHSETIDPRKIYFKEFRRLAREANEMISKRKEADSKRIKAETGFKASEEKYTALQENVPIGIFRATPDGKLISVNQFFVEMLGYLSKEHIMSVTSASLYANIDDRDKLIKALQFNKVLKDYEADLIKKDGSIIICSLNIKAVFDKKGYLEFQDGSIMDITGRKEDRLKLESSLKEKEVMMREIYHRVKNNLQVIGSLLRMQGRQIEDEEIRELFTESRNRVRTMSMVHEKLYRSPNLSGIDFSGYVSNLASLLINSSKLDPLSVKLNVNVNRIKLNVTNAIPCGLILNELITNSLKHAGSITKPIITIDLFRRPDKMYVLSVADNGKGFPEDFSFENATTLGLQLVHSLTQQLHGEIEIIRNNGTTVKIVFEGIGERSSKAKTIF